MKRCISGSVVNLSQKQAELLSNHGRNALLYSYLKKKSEFAKFEPFTIQSSSIDNLSLSRHTVEFRC